MKIKMSTCVKVQETHFYQVSWRFSKKYTLLKGGMPSLLKFLSIPLIPYTLSHMEAWNHGIVENGIMESWNHGIMES